MFAAFQTLRCAWTHFIVTCWNTSKSASDRRNRGHQNVVFILAVHLPTSIFLLSLTVVSL